MIVISGALVLVALVLLIFGITTTDLDFVYASIVVSLVSFAFLLIGILQRRGDRGADTSAPRTASSTEKEPAAAEPAEVEESVTPIPPRPRQRAAAGSSRMQQPVADEPVEDAPTEQIALADDDLDGELAAGTVLVVPGRPRYHVAGCRYLTGKSATEVEADDAREEGFTPCGVCKPDDALAAQSEPVGEPVADEEPEPEPVAAAAPARRTRSTSAPRKAPAKRAPRPSRAGSARTQPSPAAVAAAAEPTSDAVLETVASEAPASPDGAAAAPAAPAASRRTGNVVIIPDRGKFHRSECRYVRNAEGTSTLSRTAATRQGYDACGVCKP